MNNQIKICAYFLIKVIRIKKMYWRSISSYFLYIISLKIQLFNKNNSSHYHSSTNTHSTSMNEDNLMYVLLRNVNLRTIRLAVQEYLFKGIYKYSYKNKYRKKIYNIIVTLREDIVSLKNV